MSLQQPAFAIVWLFYSVIHFQIAISTVFYNITVTQFLDDLLFA